MATSITINIKGDASDFSKTADGVEVKIKGMADAGEGAGGKFASLSSSLQSFGMAAAAGIAAIGVAVVGLGVGAFMLGQEFQDAYNTIQRGTGAMGADLGELKDSFRKVVTDVPTSFGDAASAITMVHQRLGLMGPPLTELSEKFLELSKITGVDLKSSVQAMTRVFGDWSIKDQSKAMDEMFRASQMTGVGIDKLAEQVVQFGAPLRGLGFGFEESVAMLGKWEKEGVNVTNVMGAMKKAYGQFAKDFGEKAPEEFRKFVAEISKAPSASAAAALAIEKLGVRNGPDFAAAVKEGRFAYGDLVDGIVNGSNTITGTAESTRTLGDRWEQFVNRMKVAVEPLATTVFTNVMNVADQLGGHIEGLVATAQPLFEQLSRGVQLFIGAFTGEGAEGSSSLGSWGEAIANLGIQARQIWDEWAPRISEAMSTIVGKLQEFGNWALTNQDVLTTLGIIFGVVLLTAVYALTTAMASLAFAVFSVALPFIAVGLAVYGLVTGFRLAYENLEWFRTAVDTVVQWVMIYGPIAFEMLRSAVQVAFDWIANVAVPFVVAAFASFMGFLQNTLWPAVQMVWSGIQIAIGWAVNAILPIISFLVDFIASNFGHIAEIARNIWDMISNIISNAWQIISNIIQLGLNLISGNWGAAWDNIKNILSAVWDTIRNVVSNGVGVVREVLQTLAAFVGSIGGRMFEGIATGFRNVINSIIDKWNSLHFTLPSIDLFGTHIGGNTISVPGIPRFQTGGTFHTRGGGAGLAILHDGERVIPPAMSGIRGGSAGTTVVINVPQGFVGSEEALSRAIMRAMVAGQRAGVPMPWEQNVRTL
jgi:phage-related minor tail protein